MISYTKRQRAQTAAAVVGVDAGKYTHTLVVRPRGGRDSKPHTFETTRDGFDGAVAFVREAVPDAAPAEILVGIEFAGVYGFTLAHYLDRLGFPVVSVLPAHSKRWKEVVHNQRLKTDAKDALVITDLLAQGNFVAFPFLEPAYADLRCLVSARERVSVERRAAITRLKSVLEIVWPEFERRFKDFSKKTPIALLARFPHPEAFLSAPKRSVLHVLRKASRGHLGDETYAELREAAARTLALPGARGALKDEVPLLVQRIELLVRQRRTLDEAMVETLERVPAARSVLSVPEVAPVTAAVFLGSIGDPKAYENERQVLKVAGLGLVEASSGTMKSNVRISKRGRPALRRHLYMLALRSVQTGGIYREAYEALLERNGGRKIPAVVAISRKLVGLLYSVARDGRLWTPEPPR